MEQQAFLQMINARQGIIHKITRLYTNSLQDREDLFQEIVFQLWKSVDSFKGESKITSWLYRVALNTAMATFRKRPPPVTYLYPPPQWPAEQIREDDEQEEQLFHALKMLDDGEKALIALYLEDMSYREMAAITGLTETHIGVKLNRIKTKIKKLVNH